jgi:carboxyl-terminal processing protease
MKKVLQRTFISASVLLATFAHAFEPTISIQELPVLAQEDQHSEASKRLVNLFTRSHYKSVDFDDAFAVDVFERYLKQLDHYRTIFLQSDIDNFNKYALSFKKDFRQGRLAPAYDIYTVGIQRRYERFAYALTLLDTEIKFDNDDQYYFDTSESDWAATTEHLDELWRQKVKYEALNLKLTGKDWPEIQKLLRKRYETAIKRLKQTQSEDVFQTLMNAYARSIEPHTSYLSPRNADRFKTEMNLSLEGIGAVLQTIDDYTVIRSLVAGGPADSTKQLKAEDKIVGVAQDDNTIVDIVGWRLDDVVDKIKGPKGTKVRLEIVRGEGASAKHKIVEIVRDKVRLEDRAAKSKVLELQGEKVGVIEIPSFYDGLTKNVLTEINKLKKDQVTSIIIDLRDNGGGALKEANLLSGLFFDSGPTVQIRDARDKVNVLTDNDGKTYYSGPLVVLVNRYSASASEIFAAALQDYGRALVVGEQTFGKGTVQQHRTLARLYDLYDKQIGSVQYTISKFYRINGGSTQLHGVMPDIAFPSAIKPEDTGESIEDNALPWDHIRKAGFDKVSTVKPYLNGLIEKHDKRVAVNPEFGYIQEDIIKYKKELDNKTISLNESVRLVEREKIEDIRLQRLNDRLKRNNLPAVKSFDDKPEDFEFDDAFLLESANIAIDLYKSS